MKGSTLFLKEEAIQELVNGLAQQINHEFKNTKDPLILICPLKGSLFFLADLIRKIKLPVIPDFISIESNKNHFHIAYDINVPIKNQNVLIIKEVLNAGRKLLFLKKRIEADHPKTLKIVTLIDKPSQRELDLQPDFFGMSIDDRYLFGYGLDHEKKHRNLRDFYFLTQ